MGLQTYFEEFNKKIKMDFDELSELAEKRDILLKKLRGNSALPSFEKFDQGSYAMFTGVQPLDKEYDIDVGLRFNVNKDDYTELELKQKIKEILDTHTEYGAEIKKPCVTVKYKKDGELAYHVDLVTYAYEDKDNKESQLYLARGTNDNNKEWEKADPLGLIDKIMTKWEDSAQRDQYRRIIRYLKRWKNLKFNSRGNSEPPGIGITLLAYEKFQPQTYDYLESKYIFDDLEALIYLVEQIKNSFTITIYSEEKKEYLYTIQAFLPVEPKTNVFSKMTDIQTTEFKKKIEKLLDDLKEVKNESDIFEQCTKLNKIFGDDFPIPEKKDVSTKQRNSLPSSSESGR